MRFSKLMEISQNNELELRYYFHGVRTNRQMAPLT